MKTTLPEIFEEIQKAETVHEKKKIILDNYSVSLAACLKMLFDPTIRLNLPTGLPDDYKFNQHPYASLERMIRSVPALVALDAGAKLEKAWLRILFPMTKEEVILLTALKDKDLEIGLTLTDVQELFPSLFANITSDVLEALEKKTEASSKSEVDGSRSSTPESNVIPDDPYGAKFEPLKIEEDPSLPSPVTENPGVEVPGTIGDVEELAGTESKEAASAKKPAKKASKKKD